MQVLSFTVSGSRFSIPLEKTRKVVPLMALRPLPRSAPCVVGVMNLGGESVPVIDLSMRLGLGDVKPYGTTTSIVVCQRDDRACGLIADRILGVETIAEDGVFDDNVLHAETMPYVGLFHAKDGQQTLILDLERTFELGYPSDATLAAAGGAASPRASEATS